jgi:hypothetical protein
MFQHPYMVEIIEEERRREKYAEAQQWRMYQESLDKSLRGPGLGERFFQWLAQRFVRIGQSIQQARAARAARPAKADRPTQQMWREECETC